MKQDIEHGIMNDENHNKDDSRLGRGYNRYKKHHHNYQDSQDKHYGKDNGYNNNNKHKKRRRMKDGGGEYIHDDRVLVLDRLPLEVTWRDILDSTIRFHKAQYVSMEKSIHSNYQQAWVTMSNSECANKLRQEPAWPYHSHLTKKKSSFHVDSSSVPTRPHQPVTPMSSTPLSKSNFEYTGVPHPPLPPPETIDPSLNSVQQTKNSDENKNYLPNKNESSSSSVMADWEQKKNLLEKRESMYQKQLALHKQILQKIKTSQKLKDILNLQTKINSLKKEYLQHLQDKPTTAIVSKSNKMNSNNKNANYYRLDKRTTTLQTTDQAATIPTIQTLIKQEFPQYLDQLQIYLSTTTSTFESHQENKNNESVHDGSSYAKNITCICIKCPNRIIAERMKAKTSWGWYHNPKNINPDFNDNTQQQQNLTDGPTEEEAVVSITTVLDKQLQQDVNRNHDYEEEHDEILVDYDDDEE